jgi:hypothetical protein
MKVYENNEYFEALKMAPQTDHYEIIMGFYLYNRISHTNGSFKVQEMEDHFIISDIGLHDEKQNFILRDKK